MSKVRLASTVIPTGIDPASLVRRRSREDLDEASGALPRVPVLLFVASLSPEKRPERALDVLKYVRETLPCARLWVVGDGPMRSELESRAQAMGLHDAVRFFGVQNDVGSFFSAADTLLLTSDTEGVPAVVLEAGFCGIPVVASAVGGVPECVSDGVTGFLVAPGDIGAAGEACLRLLRDVELRDRLGGMARKVVREQYTITAIATRFSAFYEQLLDHPVDRRGNSARPLAELCSTER
jgi:glycosyltransferase involved in cell wall biosynthesis